MRETPRSRSIAFEIPSMTDGNDGLRDGTPTSAHSPRHGPRLDCAGTNENIFSANDVPFQKAPTIATNLGMHFFRQRPREVLCLLEHPCLLDSQSQ
jgi:hypothetical protein